MRFFNATFGLLGLAATALATTSGFHAITHPGMEETVDAGSVYTIEWEYATEYPGQVTLELLGGNTQGTLMSIATLGTTNGSQEAFPWDVSDSLGNLNVYGIRISLTDDPTTFQYSTPFNIKSDGSNSSFASNSTSTSKPSTTNTTAISTTFVIVTTTLPVSTIQSPPQVTISASETATSTSQPHSGQTLNTGAIAGITGGAIACLAVLLGMVSACVKLMQRRQEAYRKM